MEKKVYPLTDLILMDSAQMDYLQYVIESNRSSILVGLPEREWTIVNKTLNGDIEVVFERKYPVAIKK